MRRFSRSTAYVLVALLTVVGLVLGGCSQIPDVFGNAPVQASPAEAAPPAEAPATIQMPRQTGDVIQAPSQELLARIYEETLPSVVNIQVKTQATGLFGAPGLAQGEGTGWIWDEEGYIVTNNHVVENAVEVLVNFYNGLWAPAEVVATDPQADLAVLRVDPPEGMELKPLQLAQNPVKVGHYVVALGSPFGLDGSMTLGIVSALGRSFAVGRTAGTRYALPDIIQTDAAINPGNSGGPLLNLDGQVVGVNFAINSPVRANSGVGFAIPASIVGKIVPALIQEGFYRYPFLGIAGTTITADVAQQEEIPPNVLGVFVARVVPGGPSDEAGVRPGDIIVAIDEMPVRSFEDLISYLIEETQPGDQVVLEVLRNGRERTIQVTLGERPREETGQPQAERISAAQAIQIAMDAVEAAGIDREEILGVSVERGARRDQPTWIVTVTTRSREATVVVDAESGEVLDLEVSTR